MIAQVEVLGTRLETVGVANTLTRLSDILSEAQSVKILTAYFGEETFTILDDLLGDHAQLELLLGMNSASRAAVTGARDFAQRRSSGAVRVARASGANILHPKLLICRDEAYSYGLVGSSNFTSGGLRSNVELNVLLREDCANDIGVGPVSVMERAFDQLFADSLAPTSAQWTNLIRLAPEKPPGGDTRQLGLSAVEEVVPVIGGEVLSSPRPTVRRPDLHFPKTGYRTLLVQLSAADCNRPEWSPTGDGTSQLNLPREAVEALGIREGSNDPVAMEAVGVDRMVGPPRLLKSGLWQRAPRGPGRVPEAPRFTFRKEHRLFVLDDIGAPQEGDVLVLEFPEGGPWSGSPMRSAVLRRSEAERRGLLPKARRRRGTRPRTLPALYWELRPTSVL